MWSATRARTTGRAHKTKTLPCQDFAENWVLPGCLLCVVSDGASDARLGEIGALIAGESFRKYFSEIKLNRLQSQSFAQTTKEIKHIIDMYIAQKSRVVHFSTQAIDYAATTAFIAIFEEDDCFVYGVIGDCAIISYDASGKYSLLTDTKMNQAVLRPDFISDDPLEMKIGFGVLSEYKGFLLTTDGCAKAGLVSFDGTPVSEVAGPIFEFVQGSQDPQIELEDFLSRNFSQFTSDDLSMCVAYPAQRHPSVMTVEKIEKSPVAGSSGSVDRTCRVKLCISLPQLSIQCVTSRLNGLHSKSRKSAGRTPHKVRKASKGKREKKC